MKQNKEDLKKSFDKIAGDYDYETQTIWQAVTEYVNEQNILYELYKLEEALKTEDLTILDVGAVTDKWAINLAKRGYDVTLIDISSRMLKIAAQKIEEEKLDINIIVDNVEAMPFEKESFDFILATGGTISHTPNPGKFLEEAYRVLKADGRIWIDYFNSLGWAMGHKNYNLKIETALADEKLIRILGWDYPTRTFTPERMKELLKENCFRISRTYGNTVLMNSMSLEEKYSREYNPDKIAELRKIELALSRKKNCFGSSLYCQTVAQKVTDK